MKFEIKESINLLDFVKKNFPEVSLTKAKKMILYNCFSIGGAEIKSIEYILHKGDTLEYRKYSGGLHIAREKRDIAVLYEDEDIIVVNKSSFQQVLVANAKNDSSLMTLTKSYLKRKYHKNELYLIFAPEKDESGIVLFAKNKYCKNWLIKQKHTFIFHIEAIVENSLKHKNDKIRFFVKENDGIYSLGKEKEDGVGNVYLQYKFVEDLTQGDKIYSQIVISQTGCRAYLNRFLLKEMGNNVLNDGIFVKENRVSKKESNNKGVLKYCVKYLEMLRPANGKKLKIETSLPRNFIHVSL